MFKLCSFLVGLCLVLVSAEEVQDKQVVIVGAGAAGIAAATILLENGFRNVKILEAQNYYGGRIRTVFDEDNQRFELGASRIEGKTGNSAYNILVRAGLAPEHVETPPAFPNKKNIYESLKSDEKFYVLSNGEAFPIDDLKPFFDVMTNTLDELHNSTDTISEFYHKKFNEISDNPEKIGLALSFAQIYAETSSPSSNWDHTIGIGHGAQKKLDGVFFPTGGMKSILDVLMEVENGKLNKKWSQVLNLNSEVTLIDWSKSKPVISYVDRSVNENHEIVADFVIVTVSLGVMKAKSSEIFYPKLPEKMTKAINAFNFGQENFIYFKFSEKWWPQDKGLHIIWRPEDKATLEKQDLWLPKIEVIYPEYNDTLMIYVMESEDYHSENLSEQELIGKIMPVIRKAFGKQGWDIKDPIKVTHSKWYTNPFVRGVLTYPSAVSYQNELKNSDMAPILFNSEKQPVLFFAGEATSDDFFGTVHGAIDSGVEAAQNIMHS